LKAIEDQLFKGLGVCCVHVALTLSNTKSGVMSAKAMDSYCRWANSYMSGQGDIVVGSMTCSQPAAAIMVLCYRRDQDAQW